MKTIDRSQRRRPYNAERNWFFAQGEIDFHRFTLIIGHFTEVNALPAGVAESHQRFQGFIINAIISMVSRVHSATIRVYLPRLRLAYRKAAFDDP